MRRSTPTAVAAVAALAATLALSAPAHATPVGAPQLAVPGLSIPWDVLPMPDGRVLVTERSERRIRLVDAGGALRAAAAWSAPEAVKVLGLARHPDYATNRWVYVYVTYPTQSKVLRLVDEGTSLRTDRVIFDRPIATDAIHDGGRIRFGPDGKLYVTTGDVHNPALPRDLSKLNGKILRLDDDGSAPDDNPFAERTDDGRWVYSSGHRHPQGLAWDRTGRLWESEHGPSGEAHAPVGERSGNDEVNLIVAGGDYGWPQSSGALVEPGTLAPVWVAGDKAVAPGGLVFAPDGRLYVPMLAGEHLRQFLPVGDRLVDEAVLFTGTRLRATSMVGCSLWYSTDKQAGATDEIRRVAIDPCTAAAPPAPPPAPTGPPVPVPTPPPAQTSPAALPAAAPVPQAPSVPALEPSPPAGASFPARPLDDPATRGVPALPRTTTQLASSRELAATGTTPSAAMAAGRLMNRAERALRQAGTRGLAARRTLTLHVGGVPSGILSVRVRRALPGRLPIELAAGRAAARDRSTLAVALRTTRAGRAVLRRGGPITVKLTVAHRPAGGAVSVYARTVSVGVRA